MCKILINEVMLGKRSVGFECYSMETGEIIGLTEKQVKDLMKAGNKVMGFAIGEDGQLEIDRAFCRNIMCKTGISTLTPKFETDCIVNLMFTVLGKTGEGYEAVSSRFWHGSLPEAKLKTLHELGAVNGIQVDGKGVITLCMDKDTSGTNDRQKTKGLGQEGKKEQAGAS